MVFKDRSEAGRRLAEAVARYRDEDPVVLALPRGGVPVGYEVALALHAPLDVIVVRKLGAPGQPELGIGAVVDGEHPQSVLNEDLLRELNVSEQYLQREVADELREIRRRQERYRGGHAGVAVCGRTVIIVDDGIATGGSVRAAIRAVRQAHPRRVVLAVPVAPPDTVAALRAEVDDLVCLRCPAFFHAVGQFYADFRQTTDDDVVRLLNDARAREPAPRSAAPRTP